MAESRRCSRPGCRAWSMRGRQFCRAHQPVGGAERRDPGEMELGRQFRDVFVQRVSEALASSGGSVQTVASLTEEIGALRLVMARLLDEEADASRLAISVPRIVDATVRAVRAQQTMSGATAEDLTEALTQMLLELGIGGE